MAGGLGTLALSANMVAIPIGIAAAAWGQWKASKLQSKVELALKDFARAEAKMRKQTTIMSAGGKRIDELRSSILNAKETINTQLSRSDVNDEWDMHQIYKLAHMLAALLEEPVLTDDQQKALQR